MSPYWSAHMDTQQQVAAARCLLRAGGLQRQPYVPSPDICCLAADICSVFGIRGVLLWQLQHSSRCWLR